MKRIINIVNFIRGTEPRDTQLDLFTPVKNHINEVNKYNFNATFLIQYDALIKSEYVSLLKECGENVEVGCWLEIVKPLCSKCNIKWTGRENFDWDWHSHCDMTVGYTLSERERLIDEYCKTFFAAFGYYPSVVGAWMLDAYSVNYLYKKYHIKAVLICREQCGTDGYTLWGGFYNGIYYPSKNNILCPANSIEEQINVPVIRMLGIDPINSYDGYLLGKTNTVTLEAICRVGGNNKQWVEWYFNQTFFKPTLSYCYAQVGQENSFGWDVVSIGLDTQYKLLKENVGKYNISIEKVSDTGKWYSDTYLSTTPYTYKNPDKTDLRPRNSFWYCSKFYRANLVIKENTFFIRDIFLFDSEYKERYFDKVCSTDDAYLDNLPVLDGLNWSDGKDNVAGIIPVDVNDNVVNFCSYTYKEEKNTLSLEFATEKFGIIRFDFSENKIKVSCQEKSSLLRFKINAVLDKQKLETVAANGQYKLSSKEITSSAKVQGKTFIYKYNNYNYAICLDCKAIIGKYISFDNNLSVEMKNSLR